MASGPGVSMSTKKRVFQLLVSYCQLQALTPVLGGWDWLAWSAACSAKPFGAPRVGQGVEGTHTLTRKTKSLGVRMNLGHDRPCEQQSTMLPGVNLAVGALNAGQCGMPM